MKKNKSIKLKFYNECDTNNVIIHFPTDNISVCFQNFAAGRNWKGSFATSLISYFSMFAQLGIPTYGIRACAKVRDDKEELTRTTQELVIINFVMSVISYTALAVALMLVPRLREERALYII